MCGFVYCNLNTVLDCGLHASCSPHPPTPGERSCLGVPTRTGMSICNIAIGAITACGIRLKPYLACCGVCLFVKRCSMLHGLYASGAMAMLLCLTSAGMAIIVPPMMVDCMYALMLLCLASAGMAMVGPTYDGGCALRCCYALLVQA